jgi:hypothetical protein
MPQNPLGPRPGGALSALNVTAASVVKASPGTLYRVVVVVPGTAGSLTVNDTATVAGAATANEVFSTLYSALVAGQVILLEFPFSNGIVLSAVPTGAQFSVSYA